MLQETTKGDVSPGVVFGAGPFRRPHSTHGIKHPGTLKMIVQLLFEEAKSSPRLKTHADNAKNK